jgi:hypothetical protein
MFMRRLCVVVNYLNASNVSLLIYDDVWLGMLLINIMTILIF